MEQIKIDHSAETTGTSFGLSPEREDYFIDTCKRLYNQWVRDESSTKVFDFHELLFKEVSPETQNEVYFLGFCAGMTRGKHKFEGRL